MNPANAEVPSVRYRTKSSGVVKHGAFITFVAADWSARIQIRASGAMATLGMASA